MRRSPVSPTNNSEITNVELLTLISKQFGISDTRMLFLDGKYIAADRVWVEERSMDNFPEFLAFVGIRNVNGEISDCDKYSRAFVDNLNRTIRLNTAYENPAAAGFIVYSIALNPENQLSRTAHAINIIVVSDKGEHKILFFEPQKNKFVALTEIEKNTISRVVF